MRDELTKPAADGAPSDNDPFALGRQSLRPAPRKRFYESAEAAPHEAGFAVMLDGRPVLTPAKMKLVLPNLSAAQAVAAEWEAQTEAIDPSTMPLTRIVNAALDGVAQAMESVANEIVSYAGSDLLCYRAESPASLQRAEAEVWDPILAMAEAEIGVRFVCAEGVMHIVQSPETLAAVRAAVDRIVGAGPAAPIALACLNMMTTLTGSALIALTLASGRLDLEAAWAAAHVDENFQMRLWGEDAEAMERRARRFGEMAAADRLWELLRA